MPGRGTCPYLRRPDERRFTVYTYVYMCMCIQHAYAEGLNGIIIAIIYIYACIMYRDLVVLLIF